MNRREQLQEKYEDALFALLMEDMIEEEGARLRAENERLRQDPDATVPEAVNKRCLKTIRSAFARERRRTAGRSVYRVFSKAAMVAFFCAMLFIVAYAASPEVRVKTLNLLIEISDVSTQLAFTSQGIETGALTSSGVILHGYQFPAVPDGFVLDEKLSGNDRKSAWAYYTDNNGATIYFNVYKASERAPLNVDTENAQTVENISIHGNEGLLIGKSDRIHIVWGDTAQSTFCSVICTGVGRDTAMELAVGVIFVGEDG